jgi:hypothetical protein
MGHKRNVNTALSEVAVACFIKRLQTDPRLAYIAGPGSELFEKMCFAYADSEDVEADVFKKDFAAQLRFQKVPPIEALDERDDDG